MLARSQRFLDLGRTNLLLTLLLAATACGGKEFTTAGGTAGGAGSGGSGGSSAGGSSGGAGSAGSSGSAGSGGSSCECSTGQYCRAGRCRDCSDFSVLEFGERELLDVVSGNPQGSASFPRTGASELALFYSTLHPKDGHLFYTPDFTSDVGELLGEAPGVTETGPLYFESSLGIGFNFLFSRAVDGERDIMTATWNGSSLMTVVAAPGELNAEGADDHSVAFAAASSRFFWISNRDGETELFTATLAGGAEPLELDVLSTVGEPCGAESPEFSPWVTFDGDLLLFSAYAQGDECLAVDGGATDLYAAPLDPQSGAALAPAVPLSDVNVTNARSSETTPSLSADSCTLYFASDDGEAGDFATRIYRAARR